MRYFKTFSTIILTILALSIRSLCADFQEIMNHGDAAFTDGDFTKAVEMYSQILNGGHTSAALEYNLGSAYFKLNRVGQAILHLERARRLSPRDDDIQFNLKYVKLYRQDQLDLPERSALVERFEGIRSNFTVDELAWATLVFWCIMVPGFMVYWRKRGQRFGKQVYYIFLSATILFILAAGWLSDRYRLDSQKQIVIMQAEVQIHSAPVESSKVLFILHEGMEGMVKSKTDGWLEIKLADGKTGWVQTDEIAQI